MDKGLILAGSKVKKPLNDGFVSHKRGLASFGLLMDYCDIFISYLGSHSDGTHSLQRIHWWAKYAILNFSKKQQKYLHLGQPKHPEFYSVRQSLNMWNVCLQQLMFYGEWMSLPGALREGRSDTEFDKATFDLFSEMKTTPMQIQRWIMRDIWVFV